MSEIWAQFSFIFGQFELILLSNFEVPTQIHYFYFCPTFGRILSGFGLKLLIFSEFYDPWPQIHYFKCGPLFEIIFSNFVRIWSIFWQDKGIGHDFDPSTQIHYSFCCPTPWNWVKIGWILGQIELEFGQDFIEK